MRVEPVLAAASNTAEPVQFERQAVLSAMWIHGRPPVFIAPSIGDTFAKEVTRK